MSRNAYAVYREPLLSNLGSAVRGRDEAGLVGRWREVDAVAEHAVEEAPKTLDVAGHDIAEAPHRGLGGEEQAEHAAHVIGGEGDAGGGCRVLETRA